MISYIFISVIIHFILLSIFRRWFNQSKTKIRISILFKYLLYLGYFTAFYLYLTLMKVYFINGYSTTKYVLITTLGTPILVLSLPLLYPIFKSFPIIVKDLSVFVLIVYLDLFTLKDTFGDFTLDIVLSFVIYFVNLVVYAYKTKQIGVSYYRNFYRFLSNIFKGV